MFFKELHVAALSDLMTDRQTEQRPSDGHLVELWTGWTYLRLDDFVCLDCGHGYNVVKLN